MKVLLRAPIVLLLAAVGGVSVGLAGFGGGWVWGILVPATLLPALSAAHAVRKAGRLSGRERAAWLVLAAAMALMIPIYLTDHAGLFGLEDVLISAAYACGAVAVLVVPLPNAGPYQRMVASLDALGIGIVVATCTLWLASGSEVDIAGHTAWALSDTAIIGMVGYVAVRRSQRRGLDFSLLALMGGVGAYLAGMLFSALGEVEYHIGHSADFAYMTGMTLFALAPLAPERRTAKSNRIMRPVTWAHVLVPYALVAALIAALVLNNVTSWGTSATGAVLEMAVIATMLVVLARQLAMIAEQRHKVDLEQRGVISTISHELRTPLTAVVGYLDVLADWERFGDEERTEMLRIVRNQSHVLSRVVADLVSVARDEVEFQPLHRTEVRIGELVEAAIGLVPELEQVDLRLDLARHSTVQADRERMLQVLVNFLTNAVRYGRSAVDILAFEGEGEAVIEVHDDGRGVPDQYRLVIWERFERGDYRQSAIPGSGIGLAVARGYALAHGGDTGYRRSRRLGGACFSVRIPLLRLGPQQAPARGRGGVPVG